MIKSLDERVLQVLMLMTYTNSLRTDHTHITHIGNTA